MDKEFTKNKRFVAADFDDDNNHHQTGSSWLLSSAAYEPNKDLWHSIVFDSGSDNSGRSNDNRKNRRLSCATAEDTDLTEDAEQLNAGAEHKMLRPSIPRSTLTSNPARQHMSSCPADGDWTFSGSLYPQQKPEFLSTENGVQQQQGASEVVTDKAVRQVADGPTQPDTYERMVHQGIFLGKFTKNAAENNNQQVLLSPRSSQDTSHQVSTIPTVSCQSDAKSNPCSLIVYDSHTMIAANEATAPAAFGRSNKFFFVSGDSSATTATIQQQQQQQQQQRSQSHPDFMVGNSINYSNNNNKGNKGEGNYHHQHHHLLPSPTTSSSSSSSSSSFSSTSSSNIGNQHHLSPTSSSSSSSLQLHQHPINYSNNPSIIKQEYDVDDSARSPAKPDALHQRQPCIGYATKSDLVGNEAEKAMEHENNGVSTMQQETADLSQIQQQHLSELLNSPYEYSNLNGPITATGNGQVKFIQRENGLETAAAAATGGGMVNRPRLLIAALPSTSLKLVRQRQQQTAQIFNDNRMEASPSPPSSDGSAPETPSFGPLRNRSKMHELAVQQRLITEQDPRGNGQVSLSSEEKRTLIQEGYPVPCKLPLSKQEEESLKIVRRKIKNKLSAQESRRKRKEYMETLEQRVQRYHSENANLRQRIKHLEAGNRSLGGHLKKLQQTIATTTTSTTSTTPPNNNSISNDVDINHGVDTVADSTGPSPSSNTSRRSSNDNNTDTDNKPKSVSIATQTSVCLTALIVLLSICMPTMPAGSLLPFHHQPHVEDPVSMIIKSSNHYHHQHPNSQHFSSFDDYQHDDQNIRASPNHNHRQQQPSRFPSVTSSPSRMLTSSCEIPAVNFLLSPNRPTEPTACTAAYDSFEADSLRLEQRHSAMADVRHEQDELLSLWLADSTNVGGNNMNEEIILLSSNSNNINYRQRMADTDDNNRDERHGGHDRKEANQSLTPPIAA